MKEDTDDGRVIYAAVMNRACVASLPVSPSPSMAVLRANEVDTDATVCHMAIDIRPNPNAVHIQK